MDYSELIRIASKASNEWLNDQTFYQAGAIINSLINAVEKLEIEKRQAIDMLRGTCRACKHYSWNHNVGECATCKWETASTFGEQRKDNWLYCK